MIDKLIEPVSGLLGKVIPDKDQAAKLAHEIATMSDKHAQELAMAQLEILKADAQGNWFQSSWRPLLARCPAGTANPGGWVRAKHPLPRSGRHYWEVMFKAGKRKRGEPLGGIFMVGVVSNARENL